MQEHLIVPRILLSRRLAARPLSLLALYSAATGVSLTRLMGQEYFPSDVLVGGLIGWLIGHNVVRHHHHRELKTHIKHEGSQQ